MCDPSSIVDSIGNIFSSGAGTAAASGATDIASQAATDFGGGFNGLFGDGAAQSLAAGATDAGASAAAGAALPTIADIAGTSAGSSGGGFDLSAFGGPGAPQSSAPGGGTFPPTAGSNGAATFSGGPGGIAGISTAPAASATPAATIGGGASAAAAAPPGDLSAGGTIGDLRQFDPKTLNTGITGGGSAPSGDPFANIHAPTVADAAGAAPAVGAAAGKTNSIVDAIRNPGADSILNAVGNNSGALLGGAVLGSQFLTDKSSPGGVLQAVPTTQALSTQAKTLDTAAAPLLAGLTTGTLPSGLQGAIDEATAAQKAHIRSQYAGLNLSGSTMEQQALNEVDRAAEAQKFDQIQKLVQTGLSQTQLSSQIYQQLQQAQLAGDTELSKALANFAAAAGGAGAPRQAAA